MSKAAFLLLSVIISFGQFTVARAAGGQTQLNQDKQDRPIRLKSDLVQVRAVVTDKQGQPIGNLKKEDFELLENNRHQEISFFSVENIGSQPASNKAVEQSPLRARPEAPARTVVLFVDTVHISFENLALTKRALRRFVDEQMTDSDAVAVMTSSGALGLVEQFTRDRNLLRAAIDRLTLWRISLQETLFTPYLAARIFGGDGQATALGMEILRMEEGHASPEPFVRARARQVLAEAENRRRVTLSKLRAVVDYVAEMPGQRIIALFSEGFTLSDSGGMNDTAGLQAIISRAVRFGVVIYSISAQGLKTLLIPASHPGIIEGRRGSAIQRPSITSYMSAADRDLENGLNALARDTGGEAFFNTNDLSGRLQKALNDNRIYYALAYHAQGEDSDNKNNQLRRITLRVKNHPEYRVRAQRGYTPSEVNPEEQAASPRKRLIQAMTGPMPVTTIPVALSADYFEREGVEGQVSLQVYIDANAVNYREQDRNYLFDLELATTIYDLTGKRVHVATNEAHGNVTPERFAAAKRNGYLYAERVSLKPGIYEVRVGVLEPATEKIGTATAWVDVPDLSKGKLNLSAIILGKSSNDEAQNTTPPAVDQSVSPAVTQGIRVYKKGEVLEYNMMVYPASNKNGGDGGLLMQTEIVKGEQQIYQSQWQAVSSRAVGRDKNGIVVSGNLKLNNVKPGVYELRVTVKNSESKKPAERAILFGIEP